ncbi:MAG: FKBP-type peptidyl-prolyl cis-trans isomerase [Flavobacteriales bacterium]
MRILLVAVLVLALVACDRGPYPGFKEAKSGIWFRLHVLGEGTMAPMTGDSVLMRMRIALNGNDAGSLFSSERNFEVDRARPFDAAVLERMNEGDSVTVMVSAGQFPWAQWIGTTVAPPADTAMLKVEIALLGIMDALEIEEAKRALLHRAGTDSTERLQLSHFADSSGWMRWGTSDMFCSITQVGSDTAIIRTGQLVTVKMQGTFLDGRVFDQGSAVQPITFVLGDPGQVIKGVETAVHLLHAGGAGTFIIPSSMAFGPNGSSSGIVPPWTPVRYTVEVVSVGVGTGPAQ